MILFVKSLNLGLKHCHSFLFISVRQLVENLVASLFDAIDVVVVVITAKSFRQDHIRLHHCLSLGVNGTEGRVFEQADEVSLRCLLES